MRAEFYDVYRDLNELYRLSQFDFRYMRDPGLFSNVHELRIIDEVITEAVSELGLSRKLRPDARLFLLVNLHQMIALPLAHSKHFDVSRLNVEKIIHDDVQAILQAARNESREEEISGHSVISAVSHLWGELKSTRLEVWG